ncbi:hypothetical protein KDM41_16205 [bacterium]|nr:hypothetical protein [bacterium]
MSPLRTCPPPRVPRTAVPVLLFLVAAVHAAGAEPRTRAEALRALDDSDLIEIHTDTGPALRGFPALVTGDTLLLDRQDQPEIRAAVPLAEIVRIRRYTSNTGEGARVGALSGLILAGGYGALMGAAFATWDDPDRSWVPGALAGFAVAGAVGAAGGSLLGSSIGALSHSWIDYWPTEQMPLAPATRPAPPGVTRLGLFGGAARSLTPDYTVTRLSVRASLRRDISRTLSLGPEVGYDDFNGQSVRYDGGSEAVVSQSGLLRFAVTAVLRSPEPGRSPYLTTGAGWFLGTDSFLGAHVGGGLQWRGARRHDVSLDVRYNFGLQGVSPGQVGSFWTAGLGLGFSL